MDEAVKLIETAAQARREHRLEDAYDGYTQAVTISRAGADRGSLIQALKGVGQIERDRQNFEGALVVYQEAAGLAREEPDLFLRAHTIRHLGDIFGHLGRGEDAEACYSEAVSLYREAPNAPPLDVANAIRAMAVLKEDMGATDEAHALWEEAHHIYLSLGVQAGVAESKARQARIVSEK